LKNTALDNKRNCKTEGCFWKKVPQNKGQLLPVALILVYKLPLFLQKQPSFLE